MSLRLSRLSVLLIFLVLLSACVAPPPMAGPTVSSETSSVAEEVGDSRGVMRLPHPLVFNGKEMLDPASPVENGYANVMLFDRLVGLDANGTPAPSLATSWTANEDATEWTFVLRDGVTFHDGTPFSSADVAYTIAHILDPELQSPAASLLSLIAGTETPDDQTIVFQLTQSHADFPLLLSNRSTGIIPVDSADTIGTTGMGTGPFKLETLDVLGTTILIANDDYWKGKPGLAGINLIGLADAQARILAAQSGQVDLVLAVTSTQADLVAGDDDLTVLSFPSGNWATLVMLTDTPPFDDVRVRKAMRLVADRQQMVDLVLNGAGVVSCDTPVAPTDIYRWEGECSQDIEQVKSLLADAGYADGIDVTLFASDSDPKLIPLAEVYQQQAVAAGINVTLEIAPADSFWSDVWMVEPFITSFWAERPADQILNLVWRSTGSWNESRFQNPAFDQLLDDARMTLDFETRRQIYQDAQRLLSEEGGHLIPFHTSLFYVMSTKLSGVSARDWQYLEWHTISKSE